MTSRCGIFLSLGLFLSGCAGLQGADHGVYDPYESTNRTSYKVTDAVDETVLVPIAKGYDTITPRWLQNGVLNIFQNLRSVGSAVNGFLQGKPKAGLTDLTRIVVNTTAGVGGFFDVASRMNLRYQDEDFGQTLAVWGVTKSRYVYLPFFGPTTVRDMPSTLIRSVMPRLILGHAYHWSISGLDIVSARADLLTATEVRDTSAIDPYAFTRDAYYQRRQFQIFDGQPPLEDFFEEFDDLDE